MRVFAALFVALVSSSLAEDVTVKVEKGTVKGVREDGEESGKYYYAFRGVRYAQPPTGKLRFKVRSCKKWYLSKYNSIKNNLSLFKSNPLIC